MCLFTTTPTIDRRHGVLDPPRYASHHSAHPQDATVVRLPRGSTSSYHHRRSSTNLGEGDHVIGYMESRPREIGFYEEPRMRRRERDIIGERVGSLEERRTSRRIVY